MKLTQTEKKHRRWEEILLSLEIMGFATREQLQQKHNLGSDRNALKILNSMKDYLHVRTLEKKNIYYLNAKGKELVGSENDMKWSLQVEHHVMRNDIWLYYYCPKDWQIEIPITIRSGLEQLVLVPDAMFTLEGKPYFLEVDRTQNMHKNKEKIDLYARLNPLMPDKPTIIFYTTTELRKQKLKEYGSLKGLECRVLMKEDLV